MSFFLLLLLLLCCCFLLLVVSFSLTAKVPLLGVGLSDAAVSAERVLGRRRHASSRGRARRVAEMTVTYKQQSVSSQRTRGIISCIGTTTIGEHHTSRAQSSQENITPAEHQQPHHTSRAPAAALQSIHRTGSVSQLWRRFLPGSARRRASHRPRAA